MGGTVSPAATFDVGGRDTDDPGVAAGGGGGRVDGGGGPHWPAATVHQADAVEEVCARTGAGAHNLQVNHVDRSADRRDHGEEGGGRGEGGGVRRGSARWCPGLESSHTLQSANTYIPARHLVVGR